MSRLVYLDTGLSFGPTILKRMIEEIDASRHDERLAPDRFSVREVAAHMADLEPVIHGRMEQALANPGSEVANWDQDKEAIAKNYAAWDVSDSLEQFARRRAKTVELFESLTGEQANLSS